MLFLSRATDQTLSLTLKPKKLGKGFGWSKSGGRSTQPLGDGLGGGFVLCSGPTCNASVRSAAASGLTTETFLAKAKQLEMVVDVAPYEFSTGSLGWEGSKKLSVVVDKKKLSVQVNFSCPIMNSKDPKADLESFKPKKSTSFVDELPKASAKDKDDLKKIKGIGPFIEGRLNGIGIYTFAQIAAMTLAIEEKVNEAIEYLPGRVRRDEWVAQAKKKCKKK